MSDRHDREFFFMKVNELVFNELIIFLNYIFMRRFNLIIFGNVIVCLLITITFYIKVSKKKGKLRSKQENINFIDRLDGKDVDQGGEVPNSYTVFIYFVEFFLKASRRKYRLSRSLVFLVNCFVGE